MAVVKALVTFCRTGSDDEFYVAVERLCAGELPFNVLPVPPETQLYFDAHLDKSVDPAGKYWVYPDKDRPLWTEVFSKWLSLSEATLSTVTSET